MNNNPVTAINFQKELYYAISKMVYGPLITILYDYTVIGIRVSKKTLIIFSQYMISGYDILKNHKNIFTKRFKECILDVDNENDIFILLRDGSIFIIYSKTYEEMKFICKINCKTIINGEISSEWVVLGSFDGIYIIDKINWKEYNNKQNYKDKNIKEKDLKYFEYHKGRIFCTRRVKNKIYTCADDRTIVINEINGNKLKFLERIIEKHNYFFDLKIVNNEKMYTMNIDGWMRIYKENKLVNKIYFGQNNLLTMDGNDKELYIGTRSGHIYRIIDKDVKLIHGMRFDIEKEIIVKEINKISKYYKEDLYFKENFLETKYGRLNMEMKPLDVCYYKKELVILIKNILFFINEKDKKIKEIENENLLKKINKLKLKKINNEYQIKNIFNKIQIHNKICIIWNENSAIYICIRCFNYFNYIGLSKINIVKENIIGTKKGWIFIFDKLFKISNNSIKNIKKDGIKWIIVDSENKEYLFETKFKKHTCKFILENKIKQIEIKNLEENKIKLIINLFSNDIENINNIVNNFKSIILIKYELKKENILKSKILIREKNSQIFIKKFNFNKIDKKLIFYEKFMNPDTSISFIEFTSIFFNKNSIILGTKYGIIFFILYKKEIKLYQIIDFLYVDGEVVGIEIKENNIFIYTKSGKIYLMSIYNNKIYTKKISIQNFRIIQGVFSLFLSSNGNIIIHNENLDILEIFITKVYNMCIVKVNSEINIPNCFNFIKEINLNYKFKFSNSFFIISSTKLFFLKIKKNIIFFYELILDFQNKNFFCGLENNNFFYIAGDDHFIRRIDLNTGQWYSIVAHTAQIFYIVYYNDYIYSLSSDMRINIFTLDLVFVDFISHNVNNPRIMEINNNIIIVYGESIEKILI